MPVEKLRKHLDEHEVRYTVTRHSAAYTAQEIAQSAHVSGHLLAKTVIVKLDGRLTMAVLRASDRVDLDLLRTGAGAEHADFSREEEFAAHFPGVEVGAMPPFGNLYGMRVYVDEALAQDSRIAFSAGTHREVVALDYAEFDNLVKPEVVKFAADKG